MGVLFHHDLIGDLNLRLPPTKIEWTYNVNYNTENTYGGQVVQILSINFDKLTLEGRFGMEGPHGRIIQNGERVDRSDMQLWDWTSNEAQSQYAIGLTQMTGYFQAYFTVASQGKDAKFTGHYDQTPMTITYTGGFDADERVWSVYPIEFPSYSRAIEEFAPEWRITCEIEESDYAVQQTVDSSIMDKIARLKANIGYTPFWQWSDPLGATLVDQGKAQKLKTIQDIATIQLQAGHQYNNAVDIAFAKFNQWGPNVSGDDYISILFDNASGPTFEKSVDSALAELKRKEQLGITTDPSNPSTSVQVPPITNNSPPANASIQGQIVSYAHSQLNTPYRWAGDEPGGFDCSGLTEWVYQQVGISLPHNAAAQFEQGPKLSVVQTLEPADLVFFNTDQPLGHVGIYIGDGKFIAAPHTGGVVEVDDINNDYFHPRFAGATRPWQQV